MQAGEPESATCAAVQRRKKPKELEAEAEVRLNAEIKGNVTRILLDVTDSLFGEHPPCRFTRLCPLLRLL